MQNLIKYIVEQLVDEKEAIVIEENNESEKVVQESLEALAKNRTTFVIAHRLSTIRNAGRIIVLSEEGVAEEGTHGELLDKGGVYAQLYEAGH